MEPAIDIPAQDIEKTLPLSDPVVTEIRSLRTGADYAQAVELQLLTWGESFQEVVPAGILKVTQRVGGVCAGAFDERGELQAFVYGITGIEEGRLIHWSHMLAVRPAARDRGLGRQLKQYQRRVLRGLGVELIYWTFDPLAARNAHLNLNVLGAGIREYIENMYEGSGSPLHSSGTDRLVAAWPVHESEAPQPVTEVLYDEAPLAGAGTVQAPVVRIEIPEDLSMLDAAEANSWRVRTREAFQSCLRDSYQVRGFYRSTDGRCYYVMTKGAAAAQ